MYKLHRRGHGYGIYIPRRLVLEAGVDVETDRYVVEYDPGADAFVARIIRRCRQAPEGPVTVFVPVALLEAMEAWKRRDPWELVAGCMPVPVGEEPGVDELRELARGEEFFRPDADDLLRKMKRERQPKLYFYYSVVAACRAGLKHRRAALSFASVLTSLLTGTYASFGTQELDKEGVSRLYGALRRLWRGTKDLEMAVRGAVLELLNFYRARVCGEGLELKPSRAGPDLRC